MIGGFLTITFSNQCLQTVICLLVRFLIQNHQTDNNTGTDSLQSLLLLLTWKILHTGFVLVTEKNPFLFIHSHWKLQYWPTENYKALCLLVQLIIMLYYNVIAITLHHNVISINLHYNVILITISITSKNNFHYVTMHVPLQLSLDCVVM